ncbi:MAG TPA: hypothetical protein VHM19_04915 [Polyangiales bacterium]|nr:hypothetical protein [Polyangiales bacterium]
MRKSLSFAGLGALALVLAIVMLGHDASPALAHPVGPNVPYIVTVEDEWGSTLRTFHKGGQTYVLGGYGQRYNVRVINQTGARVEAVISVDGRDVVSGRVGDFVGERGYVIEPWGMLKVEGFRRSYDEVAAFRFSSPGESYSARMGTPENIGVIGVAFFPERPRPVARPRPRLARPYAPYDYYSEGRRSDAAPSRSAEEKSRLGTMGAGTSAAPAPAAEAAPRKSAGGDALRDSDEGVTAEAEADSTNNLGTEYGESHESHVEEVTFRRADSRHPSQVIALRYDDEQGLLARGIRLYAPPRPRVWEETPNPFPRNRFAPPPP